MTSGPAFLALLGGLGLALGHVAFEAGVRPQSPARFLPTAEKGFAKLAFAFVVAGWLGVLLGELGIWSAAALLAGLGLLAATIGAATWRRQRGTLSRFGLDLDYSPAVLVLLVAIALHFYLPPFDTVLDARDQTVYQLTGANLARHGSLTIHDEGVARLEPELQRFFFPWARPEAVRSGPRFMGFFLEDVESGRVVPHGLPLYPAWVAVGYQAGGLDGGLSVPAWLAWFAAVSLYYLGRRLAHPAVGTGAALLLAINVGEIWFARFGAADLVAQGLVLVGCYGLTLQRRHGDPFFGIMAGVAFGLTWLASPFMALLVLPLGVLLVADLARDEMTPTAVWALWLPLFVVGCHAVVHWLAWSWPYIGDVLPAGGAGRMTRSGFLLRGLAALPLLGIVVWLSRRLGERGHRRAEAFLQGTSSGGRRVRRALSATLVLLAAYAYWLRPQWGEEWSGAGFVELGLTTTPLLLLLAVAGTVLWLHDHEARRGTGVILGILLSLSVLTLWDRNIIPFLFWAYRRYLPVVLPATVLLGAYGWWRLWRDAPAWLERGLRPAGGASSGTDRWSQGAARDASPATDRRAGRPSAGHLRAQGLRWLQAVARAGLAVAAAAVVYGTLETARVYQPHQEMPGTRALLADIDATLDDEALVLFEARTLLALLRLEAPLDLLSDRTVLRLPSPDVDPALLENLARAQLQAGREVFLVTTGFVHYFPYPRAVPVQRFQLDTGRLEQPTRRLPEAVVPVGLRVAAYRLEPGGRNPPLPGSLDVGEWDDFYVRDFHAVELDHRGTSFRWSNARSGVWLPGLGPEAGAVELTIGSDAPDEVAPQVVQLSLDELPMGSITVEQGWHTYTVPLPQAWGPTAGQAPFLLLETPIWRPAEIYGGPDTRRLGVKVDRISWGGEGGPESR